MSLIWAGSISLDSIFKGMQIRDQDVPNVDKNNDIKKVL